MYTCDTQFVSFGFLPVHLHLIQSEACITYALSRLIALENGRRHPGCEDRLHPQTATQHPDQRKKQSHKHGFVILLF